MDPFEVRLQFLNLLSKLTSSLASIQKVSSFAIKHGLKCGDDIWDCLIEECNSVSLNSRINLLYFLDTLLDKSINNSLPYKNLVKRDLSKLVDMVVPITREGVLNLMSTNQVLKSWRTRRLLDAETLDPILLELQGRKALVHSAESDSSSFSTFSRNDILRRIEDDRERHKRLRERIWVLPISTSLSTSLPSSSSNTSNFNPSALSHSNSTLPSPASPSSPSEVPSYLLNRTSKTKSTLPLVVGSTSSNNTISTSSTGGGNNGTGPELAIEIEFDQLWETSEEEMILALGQNGDGDDADDVDMSETGNGKKEWSLSEEDILAMRRERDRCFAFLGN